VKTAHFDKWPPHCVQGTEGAKFHPDLDLDGAIIISKGMGDEDDYSPFRGFADDGRSLEQVLRDEEVGRLYVFGLVTEVCDKAAVLDALELGFEVCFVVDASCALDSNPGDGDAAIAEMVAAGAHVTTVDQTIAENQ
jgi:nicotinamidase/pyrazinamidase